MQQSTGNSAQNKLRHSPVHQRKSRQQWIPGLFPDTIIYLPITIILDNLSRPPIWLNLKFFVPLFLRRSSHNSYPTSSHNLARQHFTRNVSKPVYHYWLNQFYLSILLHLRVRVTAPLGLATLGKRVNFSSTVTSTCLWCLSSLRTLLTPPRFIPWTPHITSTTISHPYPTNFTISLTHTWQLSHKNTLPPSTPPTLTLLFY
jgi:hypothetical protein